MRRILAAMAAFFWLTAAPAAAASHVRVVLDLSTSMRSNDPGKMALLSTVLLHDLARPNSTLGDSFVVIPFAPDWHWTDPATPPTGNRSPIRAIFGHRDDFVRQVTALPYDANATYFYPGLLAAVQDLERAPGGATDVRAIVLVTDGVPMSATRVQELQKICAEIVPRLERGNIRLYVLAFGKDADQNRDFFGKITQSAAGLRLGDYLVDPQGDRLLSSMMEIFSRSFGYSVAHPQRLPGVPSLDLEGSTKPGKVAVVVLSDRVQPLPRLRLTPPTGGTVNAPEGVHSAQAGDSQTGGSYSLLWALAPGPGSYGFDTDALRGSVAVLRPTRLTLEILPSSPLQQTERAIARTQFPLRVRIKSPSGAQGDPGPVDLSFRTLGERFANPDTGRTDYRWKSDLGAPTSGLGTPTPEGRVYDIAVEFQEYPEQPDRTYVGYLEVEARRGDAVVGSLTAEQAHRIEVHPLLAVAPVPLSSYAVKGGAAGQGLKRRDEGCSEITLELTAGRLPHPDRPRYPVRAIVTARDPTVFDRELRQASFLLDDLPLEIEGRPAAQSGPWASGRALAPEELLGKHRICVRVGKPTTGNPATELNVVFTLQEDPYDEFGVIQSHALKVPIHPPTFLEKWQSFLYSGLALLGLFAVLWYSRPRPAFPPDLGYSIGREDAVSPSLAQQPIEEATVLSLVLGFTPESPVMAPAEERLLGRVRPVNGELFRLRPARGVRIEPVDREEKIDFSRRLATLSVRRLYRLRTDRGSYLFRMEYR